MAAPTLETNAGATILRITDGTSGDPVTWDDVWNWDDGGGSSGGDGDVPIDGGGSAKVNTFMTEIIADAVYTIEKGIDIGEGATATYFASIQEMIYFVDDPDVRVLANATLQMGEKQGDFGTHGSFWSVGPDGGMNLSPSSDAGTILLYSSIFESRTNQIVRIYGIFTAINSIMQCRADSVGTSARFAFYDEGTKTFTDLFISDNDSLLLLTSPTAGGVWSHFARQNAISFNVDASLTGARISSPGVRQILAAGAGTDGVLIDPEGDEITTLFLGTATTTVAVKYTCNIHVTDKEGADLQSVDVDCEYANLVEGTDGKTYKCIQDHTAVDATHRPITGSDFGIFWELFDASGGLGGDWATGFDYKADTAEFSTQTTDANGDITEQNIQYKKWVGTSELLEVRIHKFTYTHASYPDLTMEDKTVSMPLVWEVDMGQSTSDLEAIVNSQVIDVMNVDTYPEPGQGAPAATASIFTKMNYMYKSWRNRKTNDGATSKLWNDAKDTVDQKATLTNAGGTVTVDEMESGP